MTWKYKLENCSPRGTRSCTVLSEKTKARREKRKGNEYIILCEVHGGPHIKQTKNLNALE